MIKQVRHTESTLVRTFTLDKPQPVKDPYFMLYPVEGTLEVMGQHGTLLLKKKMTVQSYSSLMSLLHPSASQETLPVRGRTFPGKPAI